MILQPVLCRFGVLIWFKANQNYIAQTLCIKRNTSDAASCSGCCVLKNKLSKIEDDAKGPKEPVSAIFKLSPEWHWIAEESGTISDILSNLLSIEYMQNWQTGLCLGYDDSIFHPPCL